MKKASQNMSASLRGQRMPGRGSETVSTGRVGRVESVSTVPGEGGVSMPPGRMHERSAAKYAEPQRRFGGSSN